MTGSFTIDIEDIANEIKEVARQSSSEEDLRQGVEFIIKTKIIEQLKQADKVEIPYTSWRPPKARYEVTLVSGARLDALYGHLIIEYEKPKSFGEPEESKTTSGFEKAIEQVKGYIRDHAEVEARLPRYFGVVLDGYKIGFVRYRQTLKNFEKKGPFEVNRNTIAKLVEAIIGLRRRALGADELLKDFGPESPVAREAIKTFYRRLLGTSARTQMLFDDWRRVFSQVCAYSPEKIKGLEEVYGFGKAEMDPEKLLFALHTYYALIMKLLAAEVASLYVAPKLWSYLKALEDAYYRGHEKLKDELKGLEEGGIFAQLKITNFLEADYFAWYLDEWDADVAKCIRSIVNNLSNYDPSAAELEPGRVKDLFKRLYQNLLPKKIRHDLGEYYTPDWLAELVLNEVGWTAETFEKKAKESGDVLAPLDLRLLDPACGSGTFLVLAIARLRDYVEEYWIDKGTALEKITKNVVGFDLNPLAVIASRTNYLVALGDMLREKGAGPIEIPIYLSDSILVERRQTLTGGVYILKTAVAEFNVPISVVEKGLLTKTLTLIDECVKGNYSSDEFRARLQREAILDESASFLLVDLFETLSKLEKEGKNRIWARILKNSFAPFFTGQFDYVVGNPPWVNWENLAEEFRKSLKELYKWYNILPSNPNAQTKIDLSMIFAYRCMDRYSVDGGMFGFLINDAAFKAMAGNGFRKFKITGMPFNVKVVHDLVSLKPFEGASNRTTVFIANKGKLTKFPIPYKKWFKSVKGQIPQNLTLDEVTKTVEIINFYAEPLGGYKPYNEVLPLLTLNRKDVFAKLDKIIKVSSYIVHGGADLYPAGVYRIKVINDVSGELVLVENLAERGRKAKVDQVQTIIEKSFLFPILESESISRWRVISYAIGVVPHDKNGRVISEGELKIRWPKTYEYFLRFKAVLERRSDYKFYGKGQPFYFVYKLAEHTLAPIKVIWNTMGTKLDTTVVTTIKHHILGEKVPVPEHVLAYIPVNTEDEAHYICSILNSSLTNLILQSIAKGGKNFATPEFINMINIKRYNPSDTLHKKLSELSKKAHQLAQQNQEDEIKKVEEELDEVVAQLYGLTDDELKEIKESLAILEGGEA
jgi:type I restriction-modification system DNA methylase subunit